MSRPDARGAATGGSGRERAALRDTLQGRIVARLRADPRVLGAWLSGSFGRSEEDEWSDFDLQVAVDDASFEAFLAERPQLYAAVGDPILVQPEMPSDNLSLGDAVYQLVYFRGLLLVDWNIGPASKAAKPGSYRLLFEERAFPVAQPERLSQVEWLEQLQWWTTFFWAMAPIAIKYCARGATRQAANQTDLLARALIALHRLIRDPQGPRPWLTWMNRPTEDEIDALLPMTGVAIDPARALQVIEAQWAAARELNAQLTSLGIEVHLEMDEQISDLVTTVAEVVAEGRFEASRYR